MRVMDVADRALIHAALGDVHRLAMVDRLALSDRTFQELADAAGLAGNLAAHHLGVLEAAGLIGRRVSDGDHRRRYLSLRHDRLDGLIERTPIAPRCVLFVCTHNSARSQFAAALWQQRTGRDADSAGTHPAQRVHPGAIRAATRFGVDLRGMTPKGYDDVVSQPDMVVSVCDRAHEAGDSWPTATLHWSIPDPVEASSGEAFQIAFTDIAERIDRLGTAHG